MLLASAVRARRSASRSRRQCSKRRDIMQGTETTKRGRSRLVLLLVGLAIVVGGAVAIAASSSDGGSSYSGSMSSSNHATPMTAKPAATAPSTVSLAANATIGQNILVD